MPLDEVRAIADATAEETLVVVDEAYGEFAEVDSAIPLVDERDDVAVLRTFSKAYGLAGLRIGYSVVPAWGEAYARVNTPFAANELACRAALAALDDEEHVAESVETARWAREYIADELDAPTVESAGNFVLAEVGDAERVAEEAQERGVIIRDCTSFGLPNHVRISTGTREGTREAVARLNETLADLGLGCSSVSGTERDEADSPIRVAVTGTPGTGKSTATALLADEYDVIHLNDRIKGDDDL